MGQERCRYSGMALLQELEHYQGMRMLPPAPEAPPGAPVAGWVLALSVLLAARLGRAASEERAYATADLQVLPLRHCRPALSPPLASHCLP